MKKLLSVVVIVMLLCFTAYAETSVSRINIAADVDGKEPIKTGMSFSKDIGKLYCFTEVITDEYPTEITHIWIYQKSIIAEVPLKIYSPKWRTHSSKIILPEWTGDWKVEIYSKSGQLLDSVNFTINE